MDLGGIFQIQTIAEGKSSGRVSLGAGTDADVSFRLEKSVQEIEITGVTGSRNIFITGN
jgi:hypothetical protein